MGNDIRNHEIVKTAIEIAQDLDGKNKKAIDTTSEVSVFKQLIKLNKDKMNEVDFNNAIKLFDNVKVENTGNKYSASYETTGAVMSYDKNGQLKMTPQKAIMIMEISQEAEPTEGETNPVTTPNAEHTEGKTNTVTNPNTESEKVSDYMAKGNKRDYFRVLKNEAETMTRDQLKAHMDATYKSISNNENIIKFQKAFNEVLAVMPAKYETVKDIKKEHKTIVEKLEQMGLKDDIHLDILKQLEKAAKNEIVNNVNSDVMADFQTRLAKLPKKANGMPDLTHEATINAMYDEVKNERKEAKKLGKKERKEAEIKLNEKEATIDNLVKTQVMSNATKYVHEAITSVLATEKDSEGAIQDAAIQYLKDNNMWDKYTANLMSRALFEKDVFAEKNPTEYKLKTKDSHGEALIEKQQKANRVRAKLVQSEAQIKDALGKNDSELFSALIRSGLVTKTEDGNYDLTVLSAMLGKLVGQDFTLSATSKENKMISEKLRTTGYMAVETGFKNLKAVEAKEFLRLCGYDIEGVDLKKALAGTAIGAAYGALAGVVSGAYAAATNPNQDVLVEGDTVINDLKVTINSDLFNNIDTENLPDGFEITQTETGVVISIYQLIKYPDVFIDISKHIPETAVKTAIAGALSGALAGALVSLKPDGEAWITSTQFMETDLAKYAKQVQHMNPKYATTLIALAETFVKDGEWDVEAYKQYLNRYAGDGSPLNEKEFYSALQDRLKEVSGNNPPVQDDNNCDETETCTANIKSDKTPDTTEAQDATYTHKRKGGDTWKGIVEAFYPGLVKKCGGLWGKNGAIKALQRELCTDENGNFDKAKFNALVTATDIPKEMKMPLRVNGIQRQINGVKAAEFQEAKGDEIKKSLDKVGRDEKVYITKVGASLYVATDDCDSSQKATGATKAEALENLKAKTKKTYSNEEELLK